MSKDAVVASVEIEQDTVKKLRADIAQLHTEKVIPLQDDLSVEAPWACAFARTSQRPRPVP